MTTQPETGYIASEIGVDALKDAAAVIRCVATGDLAGVHSILSGTDAPRHVAGMLAVLAATICLRAGLDEAGIAALLADISEDVTDTILDQPTPKAQDERG